MRLRTLRLRRGMTQVALAELACISPALVSMVENGQRSLRSANHVLALANVLRVSPHHLVGGWEDAPAPGQRTAPFPARSDSRMLGRHEQLARQFSQLVRQDGRATGDWLRRLAREPTVNPWLLLDQLATMHACRGQHKGSSIMTGALSNLARSPDRWFTAVDGARLRQLRRERGLSPAELADKADIALSTVLRLERQPQPSCRTRTLARLAAALGQPSAALTASQPVPGHAPR